MKVKIEITETERRKVEVEVTLPIFREHDLSCDSCEAIHLTRINEDLSAVTLSKSHPYGSDVIEYGIEFQESYEFDASDADYHLGRGKYASSAKSFRAMLSEILDRISSIPDGESPFEGG